MPSAFLDLRALDTVRRRLGRVAKSIAAIFSFSA